MSTPTIIDAIHGFMGDSLSQNPALLSEKRHCDLCIIPDYVSDMHLCIDGIGYYCQNCVDNGDVKSYLDRKAKYYTPEQIENYLKTIKI